jgi:hypothetical protein
MAKEMTWKEAIEKVLAKAGASMHYKDIAEQIVSLGLRKSVGATPAATVYTQLFYSIRDLGDKSPFVKVGKGEYILKEHYKASPIPGNIPSEKVAEEEQYEIITSFGMFWRRDMVLWNANARLLGVQQLGAEPVGFGKQLGIYLLYDGREVIYVGRATDQPMGRWLYQHTFDRLSTRWDRFSWFGLLPVSEKGSLSSMPPHYDSEQLVPALEAMLIEALEPRQNRKRGDDLSAVEYLQQEDPEIRKQKLKDTLESVLNKA